MRYKSDGMLYIYNTNLVPVNSKQYNTYVKLYSDSVDDFARDIALSFNKGKFNNKYTNAVYQKFIRSIR